MALSAEASAPLMSYDYPGNVRELRNLVERLAILCDGPEIADADVRRVLPGEARDLPPPPPPEVVAPPAKETGDTERSASGEPVAGLAAPSMSPVSFTGALRDQIAQAEREIILATLDRCGGNVAETARALDLERSHLYKKMKALGIKPRE
jgi:DNA-binding NtrC family response regulator